MKIARFFSVMFAVLGSLLLVGSMGFLLLSRNAQVRVLEVPQEAVACSEAFAQSLNSGDPAVAAQLIYGQPDLGLEWTGSDPETAMVWAAFTSKISFAYTGKCYATENGFARDASITTLNVSESIRKLPEYTQDMINQKIATATELEEVYDEEGRFQQELADQILQNALNQALTQDVQTVTRDVTVKLVNRDGKWWIVPDQALLQALTGLA